MFWIRFFKDIHRDIKTNGLNISKQRECCRRYTRFYFVFILNLIIAPFMYCIWWLFKKRISNKLYTNFMSKLRNDSFYIGYGLYEVDDINDFYVWLRSFILSSPTSNRRLDDDLRVCLGGWYRIWLHGDDVDPLDRGGLPMDYRDGKNTFINRFLFGPIRNPWGNGIHLKMKSSRIKTVRTTRDDRTDITMSNYGTGNARVGTYIRWYIDNDDKYWFIYERIYKSWIGWRYFYFGGVGCMDLEDGENIINSKCTRWEQSNRPCKKVKTMI